MAIAAPSKPAPALPRPPSRSQLELAFSGLQGIRDDLAGFLEDPFYEPLRAGIDAQLARLYRALREFDRTPIGAAIAYNPAERDLAADVWLDRSSDWHIATEIDRRAALADARVRIDDAPAGAGDDVESYRG